MSAVGSQPQDAEGSDPPGNDVVLTVVMPCLDERLTVGTCIDEALGFLARAGITGEVIVADNGSTDGSVDIAEARGARVVHVPDRGYGQALRGGIAAAAGRYVVMADCDASYDLAQLDAFVEQLERGADLVVGNRFAGGIEPGAMPALHRYLGNPILSFLARRFFRIPVRDFHCGLRGIRRDTAGSLPFRTSGMEFASEMIIRCAFANLRITEVPTTLRPDGRDRAPHLRRWSDGWRHLRLLLLYSPRWLFLYPGIAAMLVAAAFSGIAVDAGSSDRGVRFGVAAVGVWSVGMQSIGFAVVSKVWGARLGLLPGDVRVARFAERFRFGWALLASAITFVLGAAVLALGLARHGVDAFDILGVGAMLVAVQLALNSCLVAMSTL